MFNQVIKHNDLPPTLISLTFGLQFNQPIAPGTLPDSIKSITFGDKFNQSLGPHNLPNSLAYLHLGNLFSHLDDLTLSDGITHLAINNNVRHNENSFYWQLTSTPSSIEHISLKVNPPSEFFASCVSLSSVTLDFISDPICLLPIIPGSLSHNLTHLSLGDGYNEPIIQGQFPHSLTHLSFGMLFNQPILPGQLPPQLTHLAVGRIYSKPLVAGSIPQSVTHFKCGDLFRQTLTRNLIPSITDITVSIESHFSRFSSRSDRPLEFLDSLTDFVNTLVQIKGITVHCQDLTSGLYLDMRMINRGSILVSNAFYVAICPLSNLKYAIGHNTSLRERLKIRPKGLSGMSKLIVYGSLLVAAVAALIVFRRH
eukprot:gene12369-14510_t